MPTAVLPKQTQISSQDQVVVQGFDTENPNCIKFINSAVEKWKSEREQVYKKISKSRHGTEEGNGKGHMILTKCSIKGAAVRTKKQPQKAIRKYF